MSHPSAKSDFPGPSKTGKHKIPHRLRKRSIFFAFISTLGAVIGANCVTGAVMNLATLKLTQDPVYLGVLNCFFFAPFALSVFTMKAIHVWGKRSILLFGYASSLLFIIPLMLLPWLIEIFSETFCLGLILFCSFFRNTGLALGFTGWFPILQDIIPARVIGRFFGNLRASWQTAWLAIMLFAAWFLGKDPPWWKFGVIFSIGFLGDLVRALAILPMVEGPRKSPDDPSIGPLRTFRDFFTDPSHVMLILYIIIYSIGSSIAEPFKVKMLKNFGYSEAYIIAANAMICVGAFVSLRFWGRLADRYGNRSVFSISHIGMIFVAILWLLVEKNMFSAVLVFVLYFLLNVFNSGNGIAQTRYVMHNVSDKNPNYMNIVMVFTHLSWGVAPLLGGWFLSAADTLRVKTGALTLDPYHILFLIAASMLVIPHFLRRAFKIRSDTPTSEVIALLTRPLLNLFNPFFRFSRKNNSTQEIKKE